MASRALGWSAVILALLLSGCGGADESRTTSSTVATATTSSTTVDGSTSGAPTTTTTSPPTTAATVEDNPVNGWNRSDPVVTSEIAVAGGIAVYEGLADSVVVPATDHEEAHRTGDPVLVAVDVSTGNELWRLEASLDGRVRGVLYSPTLIEDAGLLVRYVPAQGGLVSHDLLNGTEGWETVVLGGVTSLYECDGDVCVSGPRSRARFDADSGRQLDSVTTLDGRVLMNDEGIVIVPSDGWSLEDEPKEFVAYSDWGFAEAWTIPASDVAAIVGYEITPDMGWWFELADDKSVGVAFVGGAMPEDVEVDSEEYRQAFRNRPLGAIFGFDPDNGEVLWAFSDAYPRLNDGDLVVVTPRTSMTIDEATGAVTYFTDSLIRVDSLSGEQLWSLDLGSEMDLLHVVVHESGGVVSVAAPDKRWLLDIYTGEPVDPADDVFISCDVGTDLRPYYHIDGVSYRHPQYRLPCRFSDGTIVDPVDVLLAEVEPPEAMTDAENGWWIWVDGSGALHGAKLGD